MLPSVNDSTHCGDSQGMRQVTALLVWMDFGEIWQDDRTLIEEELISFGD